MAIAKEQGHEFTADKINQFTEEELEDVSGGGGVTLEPESCGQYPGC